MYKYIYIYLSPSVLIFFFSPCQQHCIVYLFFFPFFLFFLHFFSFMLYFSACLSILYYYVIPVYVLSTSSNYPPHTGCFFFFFFFFFFVLYGSFCFILSLSVDLSTYFIHNSPWLQLLLAFLFSSLYL